MTFEHAIAAALPNVPAAGRFGRNKVFISALWCTAGLDLSLAEFKAELLKLNAARRISLSRADLVEAMDPYLVKRSETFGAAGSSFHFMVCG